MKGKNPTAEAKREKRVYAVKEEKPEGVELCEKSGSAFGMKSPKRQEVEVRRKAGAVSER